MRKFVYTNDKLVTIPVDLYHNSVPNALGGGYVERMGKVLYLFGSSQSFGYPDYSIVKPLIEQEIANPLYLRHLLEGCTAMFISRCDTFEEVLEDLEISEAKPIYLI